MPIDTKCWSSFQWTTAESNIKKDAMFDTVVAEHPFWYSAIFCVCIVSGCVNIFLNVSLTGAWWCIYASPKWVTNGSANGLSSVRRQTITWTNDHLFFYFFVRTAFNKQAPAYVNGVKTHGKTGFGADESREAEVKTALWMHFSPIGAVISWKKQRGLPKSVVDHCHGSCCVGKSFP